MLFSFQRAVRLGTWPVLAALFASSNAATRAEPVPDLPSNFVVTDRQIILTAHGVGAQIYECKPAATGQNSWAFREPVASLIQGGKTIGRHYAGPNWDLADGSGIAGKVMMSAPGSAATDIPQLELQVVTHRGAGVLQGAEHVLRLHTVGGSLAGPCDRAGDFKSVPYTADYIFLK